MNKFIIALSLSCASACVFADVGVGATPSKFATNEWFSATVSGTELSTNGCLITSGTPTYENGKIVIDSELDSPVTFTANEQTPGGDMTTVSFQLDTAVVPAESRQDLTGTSAKVAFAASEDSGTLGYYAWLGSNWVLLSGTNPVENTSYTLDVTFDNRSDSKKVQFKVDGVALHTNDVVWLSYTPTAVSPTALTIDLVGSGNVTSITGNQLTIQAEVVVVNGGKIEIKEADMTAFEMTRADTDYGTVDAFLDAKAKEAFSSTGTKFDSNVTVAEAYAIGLVTKGEDGKMAPVDDGEIKVKADAQADVATGIKVALNITPLDSSDTGATVRYKLQGSTNGNNYQTILLDNNEWVDSAADIVIPTSAVTTDNMHFFKVVTQVTLESASN